MLFELTSHSSWTCRHQDPAYNYQNIEFHEMCTEMVRIYVLIRLYANDGRSASRSGPAWASPRWKHPIFFCS